MFIGKVVEMQEYMADLNLQLQLKPKDLEVEETGKTFLANACLKASEVAKATQKWAIADDSGLTVDTLNGRPGIYSARYASTVAEQIERVLRELEDKPNRQAQFVCALAIARPDGTIALKAEGICCREFAVGNLLWRNFIFLLWKWWVWLRPYFLCSF